MPWADVFTDVPWSNGDFATEVKMDQEVANDRYLRENGDFRQVLVVAVDDPVEFGPGAGTSENHSFTLKIDATTTVLNVGSYSQGSAWQEKTAKDVDITGTAEGLHTIDLAATYADGSWRFVKTQEIEYFSIWARVSYDRGVQGGAGGNYQAFWRFYISIIGHRVAQGW